MKILRLRLSNLNSLRGDWPLDFTTSPLSESGLFAITGPTGAGKTTILDAITLALYGRAARYGSDSNPEQVMSRHTGFCSAEVEFACASGRYRSVWQLRRARNRPEGKLQNPERKVILLPDEQVLTQKINDSNRKVEELTGLDYDRFLRSVMLAQGDFAAFLKAKSNERTELLERITGTAIYSEISIAAFRQAETAGRAHEDLLRRSGALQVLPEEVRAEREKRLASALDGLESIKVEISRLEARVQYAKDFLECAEEGRQIEIEFTRINQERQSAVTDLEALDHHERASPFIARLAALDLLADLQRRDAARLAGLRGSLPQLAEICAKAAAATTQAQTNLARAELEEESLKPLWAEVTKTDEDIARARLALRERGEVIRRDARALKQLGEEVSLRQAELTKNQELLTSLVSWLGEHALDAGIAASLTDLQVAFRSWNDRTQQCNDVAKEVAALMADHKEHEEGIAAVAPTIATLKRDVECRAIALEKLRTGLSTIASGKMLADWEQDRDCTQTRVTRLLELESTGKECASAATRSLTLSESVLGLGNKAACLVAQITRAQEQTESSRALVAASRKTLEALRLVQSFEGQRHALIAGQPCPLCGATEHPYASPDAVPSPDVAAAEVELGRSEKQLKSAQEILSRLERDQAGVTAEQKLATSDLEATAQTIKELEARRSAQQTALGLNLRLAAASELSDLMRAEATRLADLNRRIEDLRGLEATVREAERAADKAQAEFVKKLAEKEKLDALVKQVGRNLSATQDRLRAAGLSAAAGANTFQACASRFGEMSAEPADAAPIIARLQERALDYAKKTAARSSVEVAIQTNEATLTQLRRQVDAASTVVGAGRTEEAAEQERLQRLLGLRMDKFGTKNISEDQQRTTELIRTRRKELEDTRNASATATRHHEDCLSQIAELEKDVQERGRRIAVDAQTIVDAATHAGFTSIDLLRQSLLDEDRAKAAAAMRKKLNDWAQALKGRKEANDSRRAKLPVCAVEDAAVLSTLKAHFGAHQDKRGSIERSVGTLGEELRQDDERRKQQNEIAVQIRSASSEFRRWARLSDLIGSATGVAFSRFAQGLTLERLVALGNRHLAQLCPRYSLRRSRTAADDLELEIVDHYQADVSRPMRSLSGGESFLASLGLALGLSELASGHGAIESLFIDEGLGSLDAESLETAMAALENLQARGKIIGLISHVDAIKERITTQIRVHKRDGGCSELVVVSA